MNNRGEFLEFPTATAREAVEYLERRMAERRDNERRQKILDNLQLIRNRRNAEVVIPIPPGHDQELWFEKLEANGIWERVFEFVTSPSDVTSAYFACDLFKKHLEEKRKMMFLPGVLGVLRDTGRLQYNTIKTKVVTDETYNVNMNYKADHFSKCNKEVLNLRLVSKGWKDATEKEFIEEPLGFSQPDWHLKCAKGIKSASKYMCVLHHGHQVQCCFQSVEDIENAMEALPTRTSTFCSSLIRTISVHDQDCEDKESFYSKLAQFLDIHGDSVWGLAFHQLLPDYNYKGLCNLVSRMPNLKAMSLLCERDIYAPFDMQFTIAHFQEMIAQMPFPTLSSLELCAFDGFPPPGELLIVEIMNANAGIKAVNLSWWNWDNAIIPDLVWNTLGELRLEHFNLTFEFHLRENFFRNQIGKLSRFDWPLKILHVFHDRNGAISLDTFFEVLNRFRSSLVEVSLRRNVRAGYQAQPDNRVVRLHRDFPNLRRIDILSRGGN